MKHLFAFSFTLAALACATPMVAASADSDSPSTEGHHSWRAALFEARLVGFKAALALTADEQKNWPAFETALRDIAKSRMEARRRDGRGASDEGERPSPIDWMRGMSDRLGKRSTELKLLADAAAPLYASLDDPQKMVFTATLRDLAREGRRGHRRHEG